MRSLFIIPIVLLSCTPTIDKMERVGRETTDSAMSILDNLPTTTKTIYETRVQTKTLTKVVPVVQVHKEIVYAEREEIGPVMAMSRPYKPEVIRDTVYIEKVQRVLTTSTTKRRRCWFCRVDTVYVRDTVYLR
jgi:hypothetical protein